MKSSMEPTFTPWSLRDFKPVQIECTELSCIVCYETDQTQSTEWHHCQTCNAKWCDSCMEAMFDTARDHEDPDVDLVCPQCRGSIAGMQQRSRTARIIDGMGCTEEVAADLIAFEDLLTEVVRLCDCRPDGRPYFMKPVSAVARVMSRDEICDVVGRKMGQVHDAQLRRSIRAEDFAGGIALLLEGYAGVLRDEVRALTANPRPGCHLVPCRGLCCLTCLIVSPCALMDLSPPLINPLIGGGEVCVTLLRCRCGCFPVLIFQPSGDSAPQVWRMPGGRRLSERSTSLAYLDATLADPLASARRCVRLHRRACLPLFTILTSCCKTCVPSSTRERAVASRASCRLLSAWRRSREGGRSGNVRVNSHHGVVCGSERSPV